MQIVPKDPRIMTILRKTYQADAQQGRMSPSAGRAA